MRSTAALLGIVTFASAAHADVTMGETAHWRFSWDAPRACPTAQTVVERAEWLAGQHAGVRVQEARAVVEEESGFEVKLQIAGAAENNERRIRARTCDELAQATAVVLALAMGQAPLDPSPVPSPSTAPTAQVAPPPPSVVSPPSPSSPGSSSTSSSPINSGQSSPLPAPSTSVTPSPLPAPSTSVTASTSPVASVPLRPNRVHVVTTAYAGLSFALGGPVPALGIGQGIGFAKWLFELRGKWVRREIRSEEDRVASGRMSLWIGEARPCWVALDVRVCGIYEVGSLQGDGMNVDVAEHPRRYWMAAGVGAFVEHTFGRWSLLSGLDVLVPLTRPRFLLDAEQLYRPAAVTGSAWLGLRFSILPTAP